MIVFKKERVYKGIYDFVRVVIGLVIFIVMDDFVVVFCIEVCDFDVGVVVELDDFVVGVEGVIVVDVIGISVFL